MRAIYLLFLLLIVASCKTVNKPSSSIKNLEVSDPSKYRCWQGNAQPTSLDSTLEKIYVAFSLDYQRQFNKEPANCDVLTSHIREGKDIILNLSSQGLDDKSLNESFAFIKQAMQSLTIMAVDVSNNNLKQFNPLFIPGVSGNIIYLNLANNGYGGDLNSILASQVDLRNLLVLQVSGNSLNGRLELAGRLPKLIFFDASDNELTEFKVDDPWESLKYIDMSNQKNGSTLYIYDPGLLGDVVHIGLAKGNVYEGALLSNKLPRLGSLDLSRSNPSQVTILTTSATVLDLRSSNNFSLQGTPQYRTIWRDNCSGVSRCRNAGELPIGGCMTRDLLQELSKAIEVDEVVNGVKVQQSHIDSLKKAVSDLDPICA